ncbi:MAG: hypothetical protein RQ966_20635 [Acetobacteraceae bacterium]|nr:hypothetical protein [Acetobacteraceae bacterium]
MMLSGLRRRSLLQTGALAAGTLALSGLVSGGASAAPIVPNPVPLEGSLIAWIVVGPEHVELRLGHFGGYGEMVGSPPMLLGRFEKVIRAEPTSAWDQVRLGCRHAQALATDMAASSWGVSPGDCITSADAIVHSPSKRRVAYGTWVDIV